MDRPDGDDNNVLDSKDVISVVEEHYSVDKLKSVSGRIRVKTTTETVDEVVRTTLRGETFEVTRIPVDRIVTEAPAIRTEGDVTIVPVLEEVVVVQKQLRLKEELHIRRRSTEEEVETPITLRKQRADIDRLSEEED